MDRGQSLGVRRINYLLVGAGFTEFNKLFTVREVTFDPLQSHVTDAIMFKLVK